LRSIRASVGAAMAGGVRHLVYVSVAHPAPVMREYIAARTAGEAAVRASRIPATILRPWYVLGPGHRWPYLLLPAYALLQRLPATAEGAQRLGLVSRDEMVGALVHAVEHPSVAMRVSSADSDADAVVIVGVPEIRMSAAA
jgi:uncharacterized protein YbjT (DUF2867 family)